MFLIPMLLAYESGVLLLGGAPGGVRNGADNWMRFGLTALGLPYFWLPPLMLVTALFGWNLVRRGDRPKDMVGVLTGMSIESVGFALGLWGVSRGSCRSCNNSACNWRFLQGRDRPCVRW